MIKKILLLVFLLSLLVILLGNFSKLPADLPSDSQSAKRLSDRPYSVDLEKRRLVDPSRGTDANGSYPGSDQREFDLYVWRPKNKPASPQPLLVYSHGFMSYGKGGSYIAEYLASHGYTVAAATYPLSNYSAPGGPRAEDVVNQPGDVRFIIDTLLSESADPQSGSYQTIDASRIAAAGLSLGGMTTKLAAYHPRYADKRIKAAVSIAGPSFVFAERFFAGRNIPFMMIATPQDAIVPFDFNAKDITDRVPNSLLLTMHGASHAGYSSAARWLRWFDNPDSIGCRALEDKIETDADANQEWFDLIGTSEEGIVRRDNPELCTMNPLPKTINPIHQHRLTTLAVAAFLECHFASDTQSRTSACQFLREDFPKENKEISISGTNDVDPT